MTISMKRPSIILILTVCLMTVIGCGGGKDLGTVEGTITKNGEPQEGLWVRFSPSEGGRPGNGRTDKSGHYEIRYTAARNGANIGDNKVVIGKGGEIDDRGNLLNPPEELMQKEVEVTSGANTFDFELTE
jgi:hypothetical protein